MKLTVMPEELKNAWRRIAGIPRSKSPADINQLVRITAADGKVSLGAQNHLVTGISRCRADVAEPGTMFVPHDRFAKVVSNIAHATKLESDANGNLLVETTGWKANMPSAEHEPQTPTLSESASSFVTNVEDLLAGMSAARQATGDSHKSFAVEMVVLDFGDEPGVCAADGVHFSSYPLTVVEEHSPTGIVLLPAASTGHVLPFFSNEEGLVRIKYDSNKAVIWNGDCALYVCLGEGRPFNIHRVLEGNKVSTWIDVSLASLSETLNKVLVTVDQESPDHSGIDVSVKDGEFTLSSTSQYGESVARCSCESEGEVEFGCRLGSARFQKAVQQVPGPLVKLGLSDNRQAVCFKGGKLTWLLAVIGD
jgi:DNA polymerase III sliding clamp (beta) subunit (PCNA family)